MFDEIHAFRTLPHRALDLRVPLVADHDDFALLTAHLADFDMHLGHQRAGGVEDLEAALLGFGAYCLGNTVGAEDDRAAGRRVGQIIDEYRPLGAQVVADELVVHDFVAHVDRRAEFLQGALDDGDGALDAGAEAAGVGEEDLHGFPLYFRGLEPCKLIAK